MSPGYSKRSLSEKLGIKPEFHVGLAGAPPGFERTLEPLPEGVRLERTLRGTFDLIHCFATNRASLAKEFPRLAKKIESSGALWISWPKKSSGVASDLGEADVREIGLASGLVDIKVCAVDDTWSGLKFVYRLKDRPKKT